jgi:hypothetical protein
MDMEAFLLCTRTATWAAQVGDLFEHWRNIVPSVETIEVELLVHLSF